MENANSSRTFAILRPSGFRLGYLISIALFASLSPFANGSTSATSRFETPQGTIDGKNTNFRLSQLPVSSGVVKLFLNEVELVQGTQYHVNGQILGLMFPTIPKVGDALVVMYQVRSIDSAAAPGGRDVVMSRERTESFVQSALSEAVAAERIPMPASSGKVNSPGVPSREIGMRQGHKLSSITLLGQRLDDRRMSNSANQQRGTEPLVGLDGTGDLPITSPYSVLLGAHSTGARAVLGTGPGATDDAMDLTTPRSILLLEQRFNSWMPTDGDASRPTVER